MDTIKAGQIWTNAHRSTDGKKTADTAALVVYQRIDDVVISVNDDDGKLQGYVNTTDLSSGKQHCIDLVDFLSQKTLFQAVQS